MQAQFPDAKVERETYGGQMRFTLPLRPEEPEQQEDGEKGGVSGLDGKSNVAGLFGALEEQSERLNVAYYSVSRATLDQVFLSIVTKHNVEEEGAAKEEEGDVKQRRWLKPWTWFVR